MPKVGSPRNEGLPQENHLLPQGKNPRIAKSPIKISLHRQPHSLASTAHPLDTKSIEIASEAQAEINVKTQAAANKPLSEAKSTLKSNIIWGLFKTCEKVVFLGADLDSVWRESRHKLLQLTGELHLENFLTVLSPKLVHIVEGFFDEGYVKRFLVSEDNFLANLTETMLVKVAANIAEAAKNDRIIVSGNGKDLPVTLEEMLSFLLTKADEKFVLVEEEFIAIESSSEDPIQRKAALKKVMQPVTDELLTILFPNGANDLPIVAGVRGIVWSRLKNTIVPDLLVDLVQQARMFQGLPGADCLRVFKGGDLLAILCQKSEAAIVSKGPQLVAENKQEIAQSILETLAAEHPNFQVDEQSTNWLAKQINAISLSQNPIIQRAWASAAKRSEAVMTYVFNAMIVSKRPEDEGLVFVSNTMMQKLHTFVTANRSQIEAQKKNALKAGVDPLQDKAYIELFKPLALEYQQGLHLMPGNEQLPEYFNKLVEYAFKEQFPVYLAKYYEGYLMPLAEMYEQEDLQKEHQTDVAVMQTLIRAATPSLPETDVQAIIKQTENICSLIATQVNKASQDYIKDLLIVEKTVKEAGKSTESSQVRAAELADLNHPHLQAFMNERLKIYVQDFIFRFILNNIERMAATGGNIHLAPLAVLEDLSGAIIDNLKNKGDLIHQANTITDPHERQLALRKLFEPMAGDIIAVLNEAGGGEIMPLPIPKVLSKEVWKQMKKVIVPDALVWLQAKRASLLTEAVNNRENIESRLPHSHIPESCRVIGEWVCQFMPTYMSTNRQKVSQDIFRAVTKHLADTGNPEGLSVEAYLKKNEKDVIKALCANMVGISDSDTLREVQGNSEKYVEMLMLHICNGVTGKLAAIENRKSDKYQADIVAKLAIRLLKVTKEQMEAINKVTEANKKSSADQISYRNMVQGFGSNLHKGVPHTPNGIQAHEDVTKLKKALEITRINLDKLKKQRMPNQSKIALARKDIEAFENKLRKATAIETQARQENFYIPFTENLLKFAQIQQPPEVPDAPWEMVKTQLVPQFLQNVFGSLLEPDQRNLLIIKIFDKINQSLETPAVSPYRVISHKMKELHKTVEKIPSEKFNKELYTATRKLRHAMKFAAGNPEDVIVKNRLADLNLVMEKLAINGKEHEQVFAAWTSLKLTIDNLITEKNKKKQALDPIQRQLNISCGELFLEIVKSVPYSALKLVFKIDKVSNLTAETIGEKVRETLVAQGSPLDIFDQIMATTVTTLQSGEWQGEGKDLRFIVEDKSNKKMPADMTLDEIEAMELAKIYQERENADKAKSLMVSVGKKLFVESMFDSLELPLSKLKDLWDSAVDVVFGKYAPALRQAIRFLGDQLIFRICGMILTGISQPFRIISGFVAELYLRYRSTLFGNYLQLDIFESLLYKLADTTLSILNGENITAVKNWQHINNLLAAALENKQTNAAFIPGTA